MKRYKALTIIEVLIALLLLSLLAVGTYPAMTKIRANSHKTEIAITIPYSLQAGINLEETIFPYQNVIGAQNIIFKDKVISEDLIEKTGEATYDKYNIKISTLLNKNNLLKSYFPMNFKYGTSSTINTTTASGIVYTSSYLRSYSNCNTLFEFINTATDVMMFADNSIYIKPNTDNIILYSLLIESPYLPNNFKIEISKNAVPILGRVDKNTLQNSFINIYYSPNMSSSQLCKSQAITGNSTTLPTYSSTVYVADTGGGSGENFLLTSTLQQNTMYSFVAKTDKKIYWTLFIGIRFVGSATDNYVKINIPTQGYGATLIYLPYNLIYSFSPEINFMKYDKLTIGLNPNTRIEASITTGSSTFGSFFLSNDSTVIKYSSIPLNIFNLQKTPIQIHVYVEPIDPTKPAGLEDVIVNYYIKN